jgi:hypothetical protein
MLVEENRIFVQILVVLRDQFLFLLMQWEYEMGKNMVQMCELVDLHKGEVREEAILYRKWKSNLHFEMRFGLWDMGNTLTHRLSIVAE